MVRWKGKEKLRMLEESNKVLRCVTWLGSNANKHLRNKIRGLKKRKWYKNIMDLIVRPLFLRSTTFITFFRTQPTRCQWSPHLSIKDLLRSQKLDHCVQMNNVIATRLVYSYVKSLEEGEGGVQLLHLLWGFCCTGGRCIQEDFSGCWISADILAKTYVYILGIFYPIPLSKALSKRSALILSMNRPLTSYTNIVALSHHLRLNSIPHTSTGSGSLLGPVFLEPLSQ